MIFLVEVLPTRIEYCKMKARLSASAACHAVTGTAGEHLTQLSVAAELARYCPASTFSSYLPVVHVELALELTNVSLLVGSAVWRTPASGVWVGVVIMASSLLWLPFAFWPALRRLSRPRCTGARRITVCVHHVPRLPAHLQRRRPARHNGSPAPATCQGECNDTGHAALAFLQE